MSSLRCLACVLMVSVLALPALGAGDVPWPTFRGPNGDGISPETGLLDAWPAEGPKLAWKLTGLGQGFSSLSFGGGRFFTMGDRGNDQYVLAYDLAGRKEAWAVKVGPAHSDKRSGGGRCTPSLDGERVYALTTAGEVVCLQMADGKEVWRKSLVKDFGGQMMSVWKFSESPLVDGDRVIVTPGAGAALLAALDKKTGETVWKTQAGGLGSKGKDGAGYGSIVISNACGVKQYVTIVGKGAVGVRASDGKLLWSYNKVANSIANISNCVVQGDYVFATTSYGTGCGLVKLVKDGETIKAEEVYFSTEFENHHGGVVLAGKHIYGGSGRNKGTLMCLEMLTGKIVWKQDPVGSGSAAILLAEGNLYVRYEDATMCLVQASSDGFKLKGKFALASKSGPSWPHPVILDKKLYIRDNDTLLVYDIAK